MKYVFTHPAPRLIPQPAPGCSGCGRRLQVLVGAVWALMGLLKYIICVIFVTAEDAECAERFSISLCPRCPLWLVLKCYPAPTPFSHIYTLPPPSLSAPYPATAALRAAGWQPAVWISAGLEPQINADERRYCS